ncbi:MAG TPA: double-strand break repair protein AddB [Stellaceae bacterium]
MKAHIYTIPPARPFLATLARGLLQMAEGDPLRLARMTVLLPTRRAARSLREAFLRLTGEGAEPGAPLLLPRLRPIGDLDAGEIGFDGAAGAEDDPSLAIPPAIPELRRRLLLTRLVLGWSRGRGEHPLLPGQAAALAAALARLLDQVATEGASFARLRELAPPELAAHWERVLDFLEILPRHWPAILAEEGVLDPAERRNRLLRRQAELWRESPPAGPVIAAGLTGGIPALTGLISAIAWMERGTVLLAGLNRFCSSEEWTEIGQDPAHPQYLLFDLLGALEIAPQEVPDWPPVATAETSERDRRLNLVAQAMRPAALTDAWRQLPPEPPEAVAGIGRYDCLSPQDEAATVALLLRRALETPGETAALVTPDRELARRVAAELGRWGIEIDDSAGAPLARTPPGAFLRLVLDLAESALAPVPLLAALKHPLAAGGLAPEIFRDRARRLESELRGPRPAPGFNGLKTALAGDKKYVLRDFVLRLHYCLGQLADLIAAESASLPDLVAAHILAAERLAATDNESAASRLWRDSAGEAAARFCHELLQAGADFPPMPGRHYPAVFEALAAGTVVRPSFGRHPRLAIWGLVEARLQQADLVVLGGLNEGTWPGPAAFDPWMSRQMRQEFGIAVPERAIGIAAHDFAQAMAAPRVALTRATRREGVPTVPSRWLLRLDAVLRAVGLEGALGPEPEIAAAAVLQDEPERYRPHSPAAPCPPLAARPRQLAVTAIETWIRDPYAIYARYILGLRALEELDEDPGRAELGIAVHEALAEFVRRFPRELPSTAEYDLQQIGRAAFGPILSRPGVWAFWWPRFERIARWFIGEELVRRATLAESVSETGGSLVIPARGGPFTVTAKADRIDRLAEGGLVIIDYKTGTLPSNAEIDNAISVQLPLEGLIAREGGFAAIAGRPLALEHWKLSTGEPPGKRHPLGEGDPTALIDQAKARLLEMIERFDDPATPYPAVPVAQWKPRYSDYAHLERLEEAEAMP